MRAWLDNQRRSPRKRRRGVRCPLPYAYVLLAERFGLAPWAIEDAPADRVQFYLELLGAEGEAQADLHGAGADEPVVWFDEEGNASGGG